MKKAGKLWILENDAFFEKELNETGDTFEYQTLEQSLNFVDDFGIAVDIGAHYGTWAIPMAKRFEQVIAFEGNPNIFECLRKNTSDIDNIRIHFNAVGDRTDNVTVDIRARQRRFKNTGLSAVLGSGPTPMITLDSLDLPVVNFLKLDIEGYELFALKGAKRTIQRCKPVIFFEDNNQCLEYNLERGQCGAFLETLGYRQLAIYYKVNFVYKYE